jgi:hypothetical protein
MEKKASRHGLDKQLQTVDKKLIILMMKAVSTSETLVNFYNAIQYNIPEGSSSWYSIMVIKSNFHENMVSQMKYCTAISIKWYLISLYFMSHL